MSSAPMGFVGDSNLSMIYEGFKVGKLTWGNGRRYITLLKVGNRLRVPYARYMVEMNLGRYLEYNEEVHHKDGNKLNDVMENLEVVNSSEHNRIHHTIYSEVTEIPCVVCNNIVRLNRKQMQNRKRNEGQGAVGPVCSKLCMSKLRKK